MDNGFISEQIISDIEESHLKERVKGLQLDFIRMLGKIKELEQNKNSIAREIEFNLDSIFDKTNKNIDEINSKINRIDLYIDSVLAKMSKAHDLIVSEVCAYSINRIVHDLGDTIRNSNKKSTKGKTNASKKVSK